MAEKQDDIFGEFEDDFQKSEKAERSIGRLPEGVYRVVLAAVDLEGDGKVVDHVVFKTGGGTTGFKLFMQILEPESVGETPVLNEIHEHVWWVTAKMLPFIKRDAATILGRDLTALGELTQIRWAGRTCEIGLKDDHYNGMVRSKVNFINPWTPETAAPAAPAAAQPAAKQEKAAAPAQQKAQQAKPKKAEPAAAPGPDPSIDF